MPYCLYVKVNRDSAILHTVAADFENASPIWILSEPFLHDFSFYVIALLRFYRTFRIFYAAEIFWNISNASWIFFLCQFFWKLEILWSPYLWNDVGSPRMCNDHIRHNYRTNKSYQILIHKKKMDFVSTHSNLQNVTLEIRSNYNTSFFVYLQSNSEWNNERDVLFFFLSSHMWWPYDDSHCSIYCDD